MRKCPRLSSFHSRIEDVMIRMHTGTMIECIIMGMKRDRNEGDEEHERITCLTVTRSPVKISVDPIQTVVSVVQDGAIAWKESLDSPSRPLR